MSALFFRKTIFGAIFAAATLAASFVSQRSAAQTPFETVAAPSFFSSENARDVEFADVPNETAPFSDGSGNFGSGFFQGVLPETPIALLPTPDDADAGAPKLDPYYSRSPSSWATTSIREARNSVFQSVGAEFWVAPSGGLERGGVFEASVDATLGLPFFTLQTPLLISPIFRWTQIETPQELQSAFDDKLSLFSQGLKFQYYFPIDERLLINANLNVMYNSDYRSKGSDSWFLNGYVAGAWKLNPQTNVLFGVYHNPAAESWRTIPVGGVVWKPSDDFYVEAVIPYPKVAKRLDWGIVDENIGASPYWVYVSGNVAGNVWGVRANDVNSANVDASGFAGRAAEARYFDYRICVGIETKTGRDVDWALEGGVAFAREFSMKTTDDAPETRREYDLKPAGILRFRVAY